MDRYYLVLDVPGSSCLGGLGRPPSQLAFAGTCGGRSRCPSRSCPVGSVPCALAHIGLCQSGSCILNIFIVHIVGCSGGPVIDGHGQLVYVDSLFQDLVADG